MGAKELRQKLLGYATPEPKPTGITIDGVEIFLRNPSIELRTKVFKFAGVRPGSDDLDFGRVQVGAALHLACDSAGTPIFEASDAEPMLAAPIGGDIERLGTLAAQALNVSPEKTEKN